MLSDIRKGKEWIMVTTTVYTSESGVSNKVKGYKSDFISSTKNVYIIYPGMRSKKEYITEIYGDNKTSGTAVVETLLYDNRNHIRFRGNEATVYKGLQAV